MMYADSYMTREEFRQMFDHRVRKHTDVYMCVYVCVPVLSCTHTFP